MTLRPSVPERVADTLFGALVAWAFSYVLPPWERRQLPTSVRAALGAIDDYATHALRLPGADAIEPRLARRRAYGALQALAGTLQRSAAEPRHVRVPLAAIAALLELGQRLMALLSVVRLILGRGGGRLQSDETRHVLRATLDAPHHSLDPKTLHTAAPLPAAPQGDTAGTLASAATRADDLDEAFTRLPSSDPGDDPMAWLRRRLCDLVEDGQRLRGAALKALAPRSD